MKISKKTTLNSVLAEEFKKNTMKKFPIFITEDLNSFGHLDNKQRRERGEDVKPMALIKQRRERGEDVNPMALVLSPSPLPLWPFPLGAGAGQQGVPWQ